MPKTYTYVLVDSKMRVYVGVTRNLKRRLAEHRAGTCKTSRKLDYRSFLVAWKWANENAQLALKLEAYLHCLSDARVMDMTVAFPRWCPGLEALVAPIELGDWEKRLYS